MLLTFLLAPNLKFGARSILQMQALCDGTRAKVTPEKNEVSKANAGDRAAVIREAYLVTASSTNEKLLTRCVALCTDLKVIL